MPRTLSVIVLAAGRGTRMKSSTPKVLFDVCGRPALHHVLHVARALAPERVVVVIGHGADAVRKAVGDAATCVVQDPPLGTGHAVREAFAALPAAADAESDVLVLYGDGPLLRPESLARLLERHRATGAAETLLTAEVQDPTGYGRVVLDAAGRVARVVEELDADPATRAIREINTGVLVVRADAARAALGRVSNANAKGEYYLTDLVELLVAGGARVERERLEDPRESLAFNGLAELAQVRAILRERIVRAHQDAGVDVVDPATTYIDVDVEIGAGTRILPCTVIGAGVRIGRDCVVGPFAHLRLRTVLEDGAEVGNFVEVKQSALGAGVKAKHLTYLGDARVGARANVGCGTITANYDGKAKHVTVIGDGAFIGSGTVLIAPVEIGPGAVTGAGAVVRRRSPVGEGEIWVGVPARPLERGDDAPAAPGEEARR